MTAPEPKSVRREFLKALIPVAGLIVIVWIAIAGLYRYLGRPNGDHAHSPAGVAKGVELKIGNTLPDVNLVPFVLGTDTNSPVALSSLPHKVMLLNFWASWCEACLTEMPSIIRLREKFKDRGFEVLAINVDEKPQTAIPRWVKRLKLPFPVFHDRNQALTSLFDVYAIPLSIVIDRNRKILFVEFGDREWDSEEVVKKLEEWMVAAP